MLHEFRTYTLQPGAVPQIGAISVIPKGNYAEITFDDLDHAISYEFLRQDIDDVYQSFSEDRNIINPATVEIMPGHLSATVSFRRVMNANAYQYRVNTENTQGDWVSFVGTLQNNMITMIIPDLEDGVTYNVQFRVSSPWQGLPVTIQVTGGRIAYSIHKDGINSQNSFLYEFHTGVPDNGVAQRIKRILLPSGIINPDSMAISGDLAYVSNAKGSHPTDYSIRVFNHAETADGDRASLVSHFLHANAGNLRLDYPMAIWGDEIYIGRSVGATNVFDRNSVNGQPITHLRELRFTGFESSYGPIGLTASESSLIICSTAVADVLERVPHNNSGMADFRVRFHADTENDNISGIAIVGDVYYTVDNQDNKMYLHNRGTPFRSNQFNAEMIRSFQLPSGLTNPLGLDIPSARE